MVLRYRYQLARAPQSSSVAGTRERTDVTTPSVQMSSVAYSIVHQSHFRLSGIRHHQAQTEDDRIAIL
ncbi:hypothetical protein D3C77_163100 [compost metagenome]